MTLRGERRAALDQATVRTDQSLEIVRFWLLDLLIRLRSRPVPRAQRDRAARSGLSRPRDSATQSPAPTEQTRLPARNRATNSAKAVSERWALWPKPPKPQTRSVALVQVEIPSKPTPVYTDEARRLHLEGEVTVEVVFAASGELRVLRILKGLDEAALRAATGIRFKPARRDDLPMDTVATLHIVFQLAN